MLALFVAVSLDVLTASPRPASTSVIVVGAVVNAAGQPLAQATVLATCGAILLGRSATDETGAFTLQIERARACQRPSAEGEQSRMEVVRVTASADGFVDVSREVELPVARSADLDAVSLQLTLPPQGPAETVTVTAARRPLRGREGPASVSVLSSRDLTATGALTLDEALRLTPGFTLFRRSSSRSANPTTQGVTLRGLSASGASRSLVLADGVPLNDPFGGWVYWSRVPRAAIDRVEVARGGASDVYGADAVGGVVQVFTVDPVGPAARASVEAGTLGTSRASAYVGGPLRGWRVFGAGELFDTSGFVPVSRTDRGLVDERAGVSTRVLTLSLAAPTMRGVTTTTRAALFDEDRTNGTPLQRNDTNERQLAVDVTGQVHDTTWRVHGYGLTQGYDQSFSAVAADRNGEQLTQRQRVPSEVVAVSAEAARASTTISWLGGFDARDTHGVLSETRLAGPTPVETREEGRERTIGFFGQASGAIASGLQVIAGVRADLLQTRLGNRPDSVDDTFVSPRASLLWHVHRDITLRGSVYRAFRRPTLNERLRGFRVGNVVTLPNRTLAPEASRGGEVAAIVSRRWGSVALTAFHTVLDDAITNVTVEQQPTLIVRERRNAGRIRAAGLEVETAWYPRRSLFVRVSAGLTDAVFTASAEGLAGKDVSQVPGAHVAFDMRYSHPRVATVGGQVRVVGPQWEDDRNTLKLSDATVVDLLVERDLVRGVALFAAVENLFDAEYDVGRTPLRTIGAPRALRFGLRAAWD
ncbi:MAG: TonB-dependent receptor [Luteitalea sp.]|nr:TonB-dependent receptor [Luteitalea sp.]